MALNHATDCGIYEKPFERDTVRYRQSYSPGLDLIFSYAISKQVKLEEQPIKILVHPIAFCIPSS